MQRYLLIVCCLLAFATRSQTIFLTAGVVEYQRSINVHKQFSGTDNQWMKAAAEKMQNFYNTQFELSFDSTHTLYRQAKDQPAFNETFLIGPAKDNVILTDLAQQKRQSAKTVFDKRYLIADSANRIRWKLYPEMREIAGFNCRKAVGRICDSVYVTAFYTDEIAVSGGPESFDGLPGMILGLAIPRLHATWFATRVRNTAPTTPFRISDKATPIDEGELSRLLSRAMKDWGDEGPRNIWWTML